MRVRDLMTQAVSCRPNTNLATAAALMWEKGCGMIPVVNESGIVIGVITDRDICIALGTRDRPASQLAVGEVISRSPVTCRPEADVHMALKMMCKERIRRVPVVSGAGKLQGVLSLTDLFLRAQHYDGTNRPAISYEDVVNTMIAIDLHQPNKSSLAAARAVA